MELMQGPPIPLTAQPAMQSEYNCEATQSYGQCRSVTGVMQGVSEVPNIQGSLPKNREVRTSLELAYHHSPYRSPYMYNVQPKESEVYGLASEYVNGDSHYRSPYMYDTQPKEPKETSLHDAASEYVGGNSHYHSTYPYDA